MNLNYPKSFFYDFFCVSFIARKVSFSIAGRRGGKTGYPCLRISLSTFLIMPSFGRLSGASMAMSVGLQFIKHCRIDSSSCRRQAMTLLFFQRAQPVGFFDVPAKSKPMMTLFLNSNISR